MSFKVKIWFLKVEILTFSYSVKIFQFLGWKKVKMVGFKVKIRQKFGFWGSKFWLLTIQVKYSVYGEKNGLNVCF